MSYSLLHRHLLSKAMVLSNNIYLQAISCIPFYPPENSKYGEQTLYTIESNILLLTWKMTSMGLWGYLPTAVFSAFDKTCHLIKSVYRKILLFNIMLLSLRTITQIWQKLLSSVQNESKIVKVENNNKTQPSLSNIYWINLWTSADALEHKGKIPHPNKTYEIPKSSLALKIECTWYLGLANTLHNVEFHFWRKKG